MTSERITEAPEQLSPESRACMVDQILMSAAESKMKGDLYIGAQYTRRLEGLGLSVDERREAMRRFKLIWRANGR